MKLKPLPSKWFPALLAMCLMGTLAGEGHLSPSSFVTEVRKGSEPPVTIVNDVLSIISTSEYEIRWQDQRNVYQSPNRAHNLRFTYLQNGFVAKRRDKRGHHDHWRIKLVLKGFGAEGHVRVPTVGQINPHGTRAVSPSDDIDIEYHNGPDGMRQNLLIKYGDSDGTLRLHFDLTLENVDVAVTEDNATYLSFVTVDQEMEEVMRYSDLNVWDAAGRELDSSFLLTDSGFAIAVNDLNAQYPVFVDPLSWYWSGTGDQTGAQFGFSVAYGKLHQGGFAHVLVGAPYYDNGQTDEGRVYLFGCGVGGINSTPLWTAESNEAYALFGYSVALADVNGDGYDDVIVGAPYYGSSYSEGRVFVWHSSTTLYNNSGTPSNARWQQNGSTYLSKFGWSVGAGDFNGDGYQDLIVGAPDDDPMKKYGKVIVYHGSSSGVTYGPNWTASTSQTQGTFGFSVASADVNDDSYDDIVIGAPAYSNGQSGEGVVFVWHGGSAGLSPNPGNGSITRGCWKRIRMELSLVTALRWLVM